MKLYIKSSTQSGFVGIWWMTDDYQIFGVSTTLDNGYNDGNYIQFSDIVNHLNLWKSIVYDTFESNADEIYKLGYKGLERGRVIYNLRTQCYEVICSNTVVNDLRFRDAVKDFYNLHSCRCDFMPLQHYQKLPLTGNPSIDSFNYEI